MSEQTAESGKMFELFLLGRREWQCRAVFRHQACGELATLMSSGSAALRGYGYSQGRSSGGGWVTPSSNATPFYLPIGNAVETQSVCG